jgi:hypothetical protein
MHPRGREQGRGGSRVVEVPRVERGGRAVIRCARHVQRLWCVVHTVGEGTVQGRLIRYRAVSVTKVPGDVFRDGAPEGNQRGARGGFRGAHGGSPVVVGGVTRHREPRSESCFEDARCEMPQSAVPEREVRVSRKARSLGSVQPTANGKKRLLFCF